MAIYYLTISFLTGTGYFFTGKKQGRRAAFCYLAVSFLAFAFLASFRYGIGFDYFSYQNIYGMVSQWSFGTIFHYIWNEPAFYLACKIFSMAGCPFPVFLIFVNMFLMAVSMQFIYRFSKLPWASVYLYITLQFLAYQMNLIRQSLAVAFFMLAYPYLKERKILPYTLLVFLGWMFHNSLLFAYPLYFLLTWEYRRKMLGLLLAATLLGYLFFDPMFAVISPMLPARYAKYSGGYFWSGNGFLYVVLPALYGGSIYLFREYIRDGRLRTIFTNSALFQFLINVFITKHFILERFAIYPFVFSLLAVPEILWGCREHGGNITLPWKKEGGWAPCCRLVLLWFLVLRGVWFCFAASEGFHRVYPYVSLLDKSLSEPE